MQVVLELLCSCIFLALDGRQLPWTSPSETFVYNRPCVSLPPHLFTCTSPITSVHPIHLQSHPVTCPATNNTTCRPYSVSHTCLPVRQQSHPLTRTPPITPVHVFNTNNICMFTCTPSITSIHPHTTNHISSPDTPPITSSDLSATNSIYSPVHHQSHQSRQFTSTPPITPVRRFRYNHI